MMVYSTFIMDDLALAEVAAGSLTGDNFDGLEGADFDADLVGRTGMVPVIRNREPAGYGVMTSLGLLNAEPEVAEAARELAVFLMQEENYIAWLHTAPGGMNPILNDIAESPAFLDYNILQPIFNPSIISSKRGAECLWVNLTQTLITFISAAMLIHILFFNLRHRPFRDYHFVVVLLILRYADSKVLCFCSL